jgi:hypothetical protein
MTKRSNLKMVARPGLADELETAIAAEADARKKLSAAQATFTKTYGEDQRYMSLKSVWNPEKAAYLEKSAVLETLKQAAVRAGNEVVRIRGLIAESITEKERRAALAEAIDAATKTGREVDDAKASARRAADLVAAADRKLKEAASAAAAARDQRASNIEEAARTGERPASVSTREARSAEADAAEDLTIAKAALAKIVGSVPELERAHQKAQEQVSKLADDVIRACSISSLLNEARALQSQLCSHRLVLRYLDHEGLVRSSEHAEVHRFLFDRDLPGQWGQVEYRMWDEDAASHPWRQAREALTRDAGAPVPTGQPT